MSVWRRVVSLVGCVLVTAGVLGCNKNSSPTAPSATVTDSFAGTLSAKGTNTHPFSVKVLGQVTITLNTVAPLPTLALGVALGSWDGTNCAVIASNTNARAGTAPVLSGKANASNFCLQVFDSGNVTEPVTYTVQVNHP